MICHKTGTVFVHIPKTGGDSINAAFLKANGLGWEKLRNLAVRINGSVHPFGNEVPPLPDYHWFTVVRNPYDRMVSEYKWRKMRGQFIGSFKRYLEVGPRTEKEARHWEPQYRFTEGVDLKILRFEDRDAINEHVFALCGQKMPHKNKAADRTDYKDFYDAEKTAIVRRLFEADFDIFGYPTTL